MSERSKIEWTDASWNPVRGCTKVSAGCKHCYAERFAERFRGVKGHPYERGFDVRLVPEALDLPLRWKKPRRVFVNSMSDLFHEEVPEAFVDRVIATTQLAYWHSYQVLTKRPARAREYFSRTTGKDNVLARVMAAAVGMWREIWPPRGYVHRGGFGWPYTNLWIGTSVEDQAAADERIPHLLATPAAVRFVSAEPLLGPVDPAAEWLARVPTLDWVIVGGESGPRARPMDLAWARSLVEQCCAASVPVFVKQLGTVPLERVALMDDAGWGETGIEGAMRRPPPPEGWTRIVTEGKAWLQRNWKLSDRKGGDPSEWPADLRVRQMPAPGPTSSLTGRGG